VPWGFYVTGVLEAGADSGIQAIAHLAEYRDLPAVPYVDRKLHGYDDASLALRPRGF
jgi:hypothetical protein